MKLSRILLKDRFWFPKPGVRPEMLNFQQHADTRCCWASKHVLSHWVPRACSILWDIVFYTICTEVRQTKARTQLRAEFFFFSRTVFLYVQCLIRKKELVAQSCLTLYNPMDCNQVPLSMKFSRQEYWSGSPCPSPGNLPNPGIKPRSPALQVDSLPFEHLGMQCLDHENGNFSASVSPCITWKAWKFLLDLIF